MGITLTLLNVKLHFRNCSCLTIKSAERGFSCFSPLQEKKANSTEKLRRRLSHVTHHESMSVLLSECVWLPQCDRWEQNAIAVSIIMARHAVWHTLEEDFKTEGIKLHKFQGAGTGMRSECTHSLNYSDSMTKHHAYHY